MDATGNAALVRGLDPAWVEPGFVLAVVLAGASPAFLVPIEIEIEIEISARGR